MSHYKRFINRGELDTACCDFRKAFGDFCILDFRKDSNSLACHTHRFRILTYDSVVMISCDNNNKYPTINNLIS
jgi:hypothetical protein